MVHKTNSSSTNNKTLQRSRTNLSRYTQPHQKEIPSRLGKDDGYRVVAQGKEIDIVAKDYSGPRKSRQAKMEISIKY